MRPLGCRFCQVVQGARPLLASDELVVVVDAKHPRCRFHRLVISREHVPQEQLLQPDTFASQGRYHELMERMALVGGQQLISAGYRAPLELLSLFPLLGKAAGNEATLGRLVFHRPPFNSISHLHLHVLGGPFDNFYRDVAHRPNMPWTRTPQQLLQLDASIRKDS